jgi:hypothetical protein
MFHNQEVNMARDGNQLMLPLEAAAPARPEQIGTSSVEYSSARGILTASSGFIDAFDYTLNPYSGCTFGCSYCYAAAFVRDQGQRERWGQWVRVKENALELLRKQRRKPLDGAAIYLSSVTDPYQPIERKLKLTHAILEELVTYHRVRLVVQTRSPLVTRDLDLLGRFPAVRVNMTVTTDDEAVRKVFEPGCASIDRRLAAIGEVQAGRHPGLHHAHATAACYRPGRLCRAPESDRRRAVCHAISSRRTRPLRRRNAGGGPYALPGARLGSGGLPAYGGAPASGITAPG